MVKSVPKPDMKVIGVGLGRTGTMSMSHALPMLGFGPCYHMVTILETKGKHIPQWKNVAKGINQTENLYEIFQGYQSGVDYPQAIYPEALYKAFPDAKYVLTVRPFHKWKLSFNNTILTIMKRMWLVKYFSPFMYMHMRWTKEMLFSPTHFDGDFDKNAEKVWYAHIERVKKAIPADQLLVYEVGEGWDRLCEFLNVPVPEKPYPRVNDSGSWNGIQRAMTVLPFYLLPLFILSDLLYKFYTWVSGFVNSEKQKTT